MIKLDIHLLFQNEINPSVKYGKDLDFYDNRGPHVDHILLHSSGMAYFYCLTIPHFGPVLLD